MDVLGYKFDSTEQATKATQAIRTQVGNVVVQEDKDITIEAPAEIASEAAEIAESHQGKPTSSFLF